MCGRYTLTIPTAEDLAKSLGIAASSELIASYRPRYNVAPTDPSWVLRMKQGARELMGASWGLVPRWAKSTEGRAKAINARSEGIETAPKFRDSFARRRCVVVADGFFEWVTEGGARKPIWFTPAEGKLLLMAGVYDKWTNPATNETMRSFSILTTRANALVEMAHDRMPVLLAANDVETWVRVPESCEITDDVRALLKPAPAGFLRATRVSTRVNSVKNDDPSCILPGDDAETPPAKPKKAKRAKKDEPATLGLFEERPTGAPRRGVH